MKKILFVIWIIVCSCKMVNHEYYPKENIEITKIYNDDDVKNFKIPKGALLVYINEKGEQIEVRGE